MRGGWRVGLWVLMAIVAGCDTASGSEGKLAVERGADEAVDAGRSGPHIARAGGGDRCARGHRIADGARSPRGPSWSFGGRRGRRRRSSSLPPSQATFDGQWVSAARAPSQLDTGAEAVAAGHTRVAVQGAGVGVHWVNWILIDQPFDLARPSMLLFDERNGREDLVGYSYWLRTDPAPDGFAGANDVWHQHTNLCVVNGWIDREMSESPRPVPVITSLVPTSGCCTRVGRSGSAQPSGGFRRAQPPCRVRRQRYTPDIARCPTSAGP